MLDSDFAQLAAILVMALAAGVIAKLLRQPLIVAYIVVGIIAGPALLNIVSTNEAVELLAQVGIAILLFLVGLKLDIHLIKSTGVVATLTGVGQVIFTSLVGFGILLLLGFDWLSATYIAVALTFSSTIIIVKLLSDKRELDELHGRIAVGFLIVQDLLVIVAMIIVVALAAPGMSERRVNVWLTIGGGLALICAVTVLAKYVLPKVIDWLARSQELTLLFSVAWAIALAAISYQLGLSMEVGAFIAGVALASTPYRESIGARLIGLRDLMILFFFIELGASMAFNNALAQLIPALVLSAFVLIGNPIIVMVIMGAMGYQKQVSFKAGLAVAQISEFSFILIALAFSLGQVDESVLGLVTTIGIITITLSTYFILYSDQLYRRLAPLLGIFERTSVSRGLRQELAERPYDAVIVGAGRLGRQLIMGLQERGAHLLVVDFDPRALASIRELGIDTLYGNVEEMEFVKSLPLHEVSSVVCAVAQPGTNVVLQQSIRRLGFAGSIWVTALDDHTATLLEAGPGITIVQPFQLAADALIAEIGARHLPQQNQEHQQHQEP